MLPCAALAFITGCMLFLRSAHVHAHSAVMLMVLCALLLLASGFALIYRVVNTALTCPAFSEEGICTGRGLYLDWENVRFGYVHRIARISGMFMLSQPLEAVRGRGAPPVECLSMPDTRTLLIAYLTYCPHANKGMDI